MPLLSTRGGLSSRGFGQLNGGASLTLRSFTFPAGSSTFTVPATTNTLISVVGAGADGSPGTTNFNVLASRQVVAFISRTIGQPVINGVSLTYDGFFSYFNSVVAAANLGGTIYYDLRSATVGTNNLSRTTADATSLDNVVPGTASAVVFPPTLPTTGPFTYDSAPPPTSPGQLVVQYRFNETIPPTTGASTTGFGLTFPGGAGGPSTTTTFNNITVVPNQTYAIQNNKSLTITYFA